MSESVIFWHHIGREYGMGGYTSDICKSDDATVQKYLAVKEQQCRENANRYIKVDAATLVELPPTDSNDNFIIVYCIDSGLQFSLHHKKQYAWWLIDIVEVEELKPDVYCVHDLLIDIAVHPDGSYQLLDVDDFEAAIRLDILKKDQIVKSLKSLNLILQELNAKAFPAPRLQTLVEKFAKPKSDS